MEDRPVKIAIRHIMAAMAWGGLLLGHRAFAADWDPLATPIPEHNTQVLPTGPQILPTGPMPTPSPTPPTGGTTSTPAMNEPANGAAAPNANPAVGPESVVPSGNPPVVGENEPAIGGLFGDQTPSACEFCGNGNCLPPKWAVTNNIAVITMSRPQDRTLGVNSLPAGPLAAGTTSYTNTATGATFSTVYQQYLNDAVKETVLETHTPALTVSPAWSFTIDRFLGRDGEERDHFLEFGFQGLENYTQMNEVVHGSIIPFYNTTPFVEAIPAPAPTALYYQGSLVSPFPIFLPVNGNQQQLIQPSFSTLGRIFDEAFNRSDTMSTRYTSTFNDFEINYRIDGHNHVDQMVLNPNGRWYRECQSGYYYSYFFGMKGMFIDESFDFASSGAQSTAPYTPGQAPEFTHAGNYSVHTSNALLGFQSGGKLEWRFCRWSFNAHGNAGMFLNLADQNTLITTTFTGTPDPASPYITPTNTSTPASATSANVAFAGGFGVGGSYKILPNLVGHVSYDLLWVGDLARAPEQLVFNSVPESELNNINTKGSIFYNGVSFGLEMDW